MTTNRAEKASIREYAVKHGLKYSEAARQLDLMLPSEFTVTDESGAEYSISILLSGSQFGKRLLLTAPWGTMRQTIQEFHEVVRTGEGVIDANGTQIVPAPVMDQFAHWATTNGLPATPVLTRAVMLERERLAHELPAIHNRETIMALNLDQLTSLLLAYGARFSPKWSRDGSIVLHCSYGNPSDRPRDISHYSEEGKRYGDDIELTFTLAGSLFHAPLSETHATGFQRYLIDLYDDLMRGHYGDTTPLKLHAEDGTVTRELEFPAPSVPHVIRIAGSRPDRTKTARDLAEQLIGRGYVLTVAADDEQEWRDIAFRTRPFHGWADALQGLSNVIYGKSVIVVDASWSNHAILKSHEDQIRSMLESETDSRNKPILIFIERDAAVLRHAAHRIVSTEIDLTPIPEPTPPNLNVLPTPEELYNVASIVVTDTSGITVSHTDGRSAKVELEQHGSETLFVLNDEFTAIFGSQLDALGNHLYRVIDQVFPRGVGKAYYVTPRHWEELQIAASKLGESAHDLLDKWTTLTTEFRKSDME